MSIKTNQIMINENTATIAELVREIDRKASLLVEAQENQQSSSGSEGWIEYIGEATEVTASQLLSEYGSGTYFLQCYSGGLYSDSALLAVGDTIYDAPVELGTGATISLSTDYMFEVFILVPLAISMWDGVTGCAITGSIHAYSSMHIFKFKEV